MGKVTLGWAFPARTNGQRQISPWRRRKLTELGSRDRHHHHHQGRTRPKSIRVNLIFHHLCLRASFGLKFLGLKFRLSRGKPTRKRFHLETTKEQEKVEKKRAKERYTDRRRRRTGLQFPPLPMPRKEEEETLVNSLYSLWVPNISVVPFLAEP